MFFFFLIIYIMFLVCIGLRYYVHIRVRTKIVNEGV